MSYSDAQETRVDVVGTLLCEVLYCRAEARLLGLDMAEYLLDMARLELETPSASGDRDVGELGWLQSQGI